MFAKLDGTLDLRNVLKAVFALFFVIYLLSHFSNHHWVLDNISHFLIQYIFVGFLFALIFLIIKAHLFAIFAGVIFIIAVAQAYYVSDGYQPEYFGSTLGSDNGSEEITIFHLNHFHFKTNFADLENWLIKKANNIDVVVLQEANSKTSEMAKNLSSIFPHQIHQHRDHPFGMVVLSKTDIFDYRLIPTSSEIIENFILQISLESLTIYALHAAPPIGKDLSNQRNQELVLLSQQISEDESRNIIALGDFNISPYSPHFRDFLRESNLNYRSSGIFGVPTWPSQMQFPLFKIPIDHILAKGDLEIIKQEATASFGSDHNGVLVSFRKKSENNL